MVYVGLLLAASSVFWLRALWYFVYPRQTDDFDNWMSRGFRVGIGGAFLLGCWLALFMPIIRALREYATRY